jgi:hypothetical protein
MAKPQAPQSGEFLLYETEDGRARVECRFAEETLWLSQAMMAELFQTSPQNITLHLKVLYAEGEISREATCLAVGNRVRSLRGTQFRRWATERLREYLVKGFVLDDERLKNPPISGSGMPDRFDELLERIRDIRASERRMYLRVREIFSMAADYSPTLPGTIPVATSSQLPHGQAGSCVRGAGSERRQDARRRRLRKNDCAYAEVHLGLPR